jgi:WD40 repeat protein
VIVWDLRTGERRATLTGHTQPVNAIACTRLDDSTPIAITAAGTVGYSSLGEVIIWDLHTRRIQQKLAAPYPVGALICDSDQGIAIGTATEMIRFQYVRPEKAGFL